MSLSPHKSRSQTINRAGRGSGACVPTAWRLTFVMECEGRRSPSPPPPAPEPTPPSPPTAADQPPTAEPPPPVASRDPGSSDPMPPSDDPDADTDTDTGTAAHGPQEPAVEEQPPPPPPAATVLADDMRDKVVTQNNEVIPLADDSGVDVGTDTASHDPQVPGDEEVPPPPVATVLTDDLRDKLVTQNNEVVPPADDPDVDAETETGTASHDPQLSGVGEVQPPPAATVLTDDLRDKIVTQVEYYFSDTNLPTDKFLLKYVKRDKLGFVPIGVIASFKRMKKLVQDISLVVSALRTSSQLVVNANGTKVKRLHPLPDSDVKDNQRFLSQPCTVIVENLPGNYSKDNIQRLFGNIGNILNITIRDPHSAEESTSRKGEIAISSKLHALIEYETVEAAERAVSSLNDEKNWSGMRVELLLKRMKKFGLIQRGHKENLSEKGDNQTPDVGMANSVDRQDNTVQTEDSSGGKSRRQSRYRSRGRGQQNSNGQGHGHVHSNCIGEGTNKPITGPKMPDGTRGFTMGRGKPALNSQNTELL